MPIVRTLGAPISKLMRRLKRSASADVRLINAEQRGFCRRLLEAAARRPGIGKAEVDLAEGFMPDRVCRQGRERTKDGRVLRGVRARGGEWISRPQEEAVRADEPTAGSR